MAPREATLRFGAATCASARRRATTFPPKQDHEPPSPARGVPCPVDMPRGPRCVAEVSAMASGRARRIPLPSNVSAADPNNAEFFGTGDQFFINQNFILSLEIFKGNTAFRPRDWEFRITPVVNFTYLDVQETGVVNIDVRRGTTRR